MYKFNSNNNVVFEEVENHLSVKFGRKVKISSIQSIGGGCINHSSKIDTNIGRFFLKWNTTGPADIFIREAESLQELKKAIAENVFIPEVFICKAIDKTPGFLVQEYFLSGNSNTEDDEKLGCGLAAIHQYKSDSFGFYSNNYCGATLQNNKWTKNWLEFFRDKRLRFLLELIQTKRPLPVSEIVIYEKLLDKIPTLLPNVSEPVLIHGDLWSGNFLISEKGPVLIDPSSSYADREMEFAIMTMFGGFSKRFYDAYNEVNQLPADWRQRNSLYQLYHVLNHYYLFGGAYRTQALSIAKSYL
jgi:protein-ribulosamine 3-kinase